MTLPLVAFITGANSGIGRAAAVGLAAKGWRVFGGMRNLESGGKLAAMAEEAGVEVTPLPCDVTDEQSVRAAIDSVVDQAGRIDVLINNAGVGGNGVLEESPVSLYAEVMDVNLYGVIRGVQAALPHMRKQGSGTIVNISSITGRIAALAQSPYVASKWALEGVSEGLAQEVAPFGIRVVIVEPGVIRTAILAKHPDVPNETGAYERANRRMLDFYAVGIDAHHTPDAITDVLYEAVTTDEPRLRWTCGWGGPELAHARANIRDEDWVALGAIEDDSAYRRRFQELFGLSIEL